jgi:hypothetical protein
VILGYCLGETVVHIVLGSEWTTLIIEEVDGVVAECEDESRSVEGEDGRGCLVLILG